MNRTISVEELGQRIEDGQPVDYRLTTSISYEKGGYNGLSGQQTERGYYLHVTPEAIETMENGVKIRRYVAFSGIKSLLQAVTRFNRNTLAALAPDPALIARLRADVLSRDAKLAAMAAAKLAPAVTP